MSPTDAAAFVDLVARRDDVLRAVDAAGIEKRELEERLSVSRSTIDRSVRELEAAGLVERSPSGYRRTVSGTVALREYDEFRSRMDAIASNRDALAPLPPTADIDAAILDGGEVVHSAQHSPLRPVRELGEVIGNATEVRSLFAVVYPTLVDAFHGAAVDRGVPTDLLATRPVVQRLLAEYAPELKAMVAAPGFDLRRADTDPACGLTVAELEDGAVACLLVLEESGVRALFKNDGPTAVEWARSRLDREWARSQPYPGPFE